MTTTNGTTTTTTIPTLSVPPGAPNKPYTLPSLAGETIYIPFSRSATRLLVTGAETEDQFAVVGSGGTHSDPIGFHFHRAAHDVFLCLKGRVNVWAEDRCRTLEPGDFASVPPGTVHRYQILGTYSEFVGLIVPGGWEEFFRFIGEPYDGGPLFPVEDERDFVQVLLPKLKRAAEEFDMVPCPQYHAVEPGAWDEKEDSVLPGELKPYFLRHDAGPAFLVGATVVRPLATTKESDSRFGVACLEGSSHRAHRECPVVPALRFAAVHHAFQVVEGKVVFELDGHAPETLCPGETIYVPAGTGFRFEWAARFAKMYAFSNGAGVAEALVRVGSSYKGVVLPEKGEQGLDLKASLGRVREEFGFELV